MRRVLALAAFALPALAHAQEQQEASLAAPGATSGGPPVFDMVAADRETAWRINRVTGEITICRVDTTAGLDVVRARCSAATIQAPGPGAPQTSSVEGGQGGKP